jgi:hypothetical protein
MTDKERTFVEAYLSTARLNATEAARQAGYIDPEKEGFRVRQRREVQDAIREGMAHLIDTGGFEKGPRHPLPLPKHRPGVYILRAENGLVKIGCCRDFGSRYRNFCNVFPYDLEIVRFIATEQFKALEQQLHRRYHSKRVRGEWFKLTEDDLRDLVATAA